MNAYIWFRGALERTRSTAPSILVSDPSDPLGAARLYGRTYAFDGETILIYSVDCIAGAEARDVVYALVFDVD